MKCHCHRAGLIWMALLLLAAMRVEAQRSNLLEFTFVSGAEGWRAIDIPDGSRYSATPAPFDPAWNANTPGFGPTLTLVDASNGTIFFEAPPTLVSRIALGYGGFLEFDLASNVRSWTSDNAVVILGVLNGQPRAIAAPLGKLPGTNWTSYALRLLPANFRYDSPTGTPVNRQDFRAILQSAQAVRLPAEFGSGLVETVHLGRVRLTSQPLLEVECVPSVSLDGEPGQRFRLEYTDSLNLGVWVPITNITLVTPSFLYLDFSGRGEPQRYYRAIELAD